MQYGVDLLASNGEFFHHLFDSQSRFQILEHRGNRHPRILKHPRAADFAGNAFDSWTLSPIESCHAQPLARYHERA